MSISLTVRNCKKSEINPKLVADLENNCQALFAFLTPSNDVLITCPTLDKVLYAQQILTETYNTLSDFVGSQLVNLTPHAITIRTFNDPEPIRTQTQGVGAPDYFDVNIPVHGPATRLATRAIEKEPIVTPSGVYPCVLTVTERTSSLPNPVDGLIFVVSMPVAQDCEMRNDVVAPDTGSTCIRKDGQIVAVTRFTRYFADRKFRDSKYFDQFPRVRGPSRSIGEMPHLD